MIRSYRYLFAIIAGLIIGLIWVNQVGLHRSVRRLDLSQHRLDEALLPIQGEREVRHQFVPRHDRWREIELLTVKYEDVAETGYLDISLWDGERLIKSERLLTGRMGHNQPYSFFFPPQKNSAGKLYELRMVGNETNGISFWGYTVPIYEDHFLVDQNQAATLRFNSYYQLDLWLGIETIGKMVGDHFSLWVLIGWLLFIPGGMLLLIGREVVGLRTNRWPLAVWWGSSLALSIGFWPLLWLWSSLFHVRWGKGSLFSLLIGLTAVFLSLWWRAGRPHQKVSGADWILLLLLLVGFAVRLLAISDLAFPPWVDAERHALISQIIAERGQLLNDYLPYLPVMEFPYHYGFHTIVATLLLLSDEQLPLLLLYVGQWMNGAIVVTIYAGSWFMSRNWRVGLVAAFFVALPFFFPGRYVAWGRYTQLTGMVLLPILLGWSWAFVRGGRGNRSLGWGMGFLIGALFLIHFRVLIVYLMGLGLLILFSNGRRWVQVGLIGLGSLLLVSGRLISLWQAGQERVIFSTGKAVVQYNQFPYGYLDSGWERPFLFLTAFSILVVAWGLFQKRRWAALPTFLIIWISGSFLLLAGDIWGGAQSWLLNRNSLYIMIFYPLAFGLAYLFVKGWQRMPQWGKLLGTIPLVAWLVVALFFGVGEQVNMVSEQTILAYEADESLLLYMKEHLPEDAFVASASWRWLGSTWAGVDGGGWVLPMTGLQSSAPPPDYLYDKRLAATVNERHAQMMEIEEWDEDAVQWLVEQGVTHIFIGAKGGYFDPAKLLEQPSLDLIYQKDGAFLFALVP